MLQPEDEKNWVRAFAGAPSRWVNRPAENGEIGIWNLAISTQSPNICVTP
jgi:hypothetical protein